MTQIEIIMKYELFLMDLDETLTKPVLGRTFPQTVNDRELMPRRDMILEDLHNLNKKTAVITNQGGRAWNIFSDVEFNLWIENFCNVLDIDAFFVCYHDTGKKAQQYPEKIVPGLGGPDLYHEPITGMDLERRKPGPGMLVQAMDHFSILHSKTVMIGDRDEDRGAAAAAKVDFIWAWKFFGDPEPSVF